MSRPRVALDGGGGDVVVGDFRYRSVGFSTTHLIWPPPSAPSVEEPSMVSCDFERDLRDIEILYFSNFRPKSEINIL